MAEESAQATRPAVRGTRAPDIEELRTLCAAAELGSLGRAALRLHASQPALSKRLSNLEAMAGVKLLERSAQGVKLTPAGRQLYDEARKLIDQADRVGETLAGIVRAGGPVRLAASHSATDAFVSRLLGHLNEHGALPVELLSANSLVVRDLVADGRADLGVAASRPHRTPYPGVRELPLADDEIICAVPSRHRWASRKGISLDEFSTTPMVMRDPSSNSRWTVEAVLRENELELPPRLVEVGTPAAAREEAAGRNAPVLVSRSVLANHDFHELPVEGISFPRAYVLVLPAYGEPPEEVRELIEQLRHEADLWLRCHRLTGGS
jgi:DNA-binding transcriptional LysR family regulator